MVDKLASEKNANSGLKDALKLAIRLAREGGDIAREIRNEGYAVRQKGEGNNPVTDADEAVSAFLVERISNAFPHDRVISEESTVSSENSWADRTWYIDPIDGTKEFIKGIDEWSVMIGLAVDARPVLGVVYQPDRDRMYYAIKNQGTFLEYENNTVQLKVNVGKDYAQATLIQSRNHGNISAERLCKQLGIKKIMQHGSIGLKFALIAEGRADLYFNFSGHCHLWDLCAPEIILEEAGGRLLLASGERFLYSGEETLIKKNFLASSANLAAEVSPFIK